MATPWAEVAANPSFKALPPEGQEAARVQYFNEVVAPQVPKEKIADVKAQFDADTSPSFASTGGGAALGNPQISRKSDPSIKTGTPTVEKMTAGERAGSIGGAAALGALGGAFAPELLTAGGAAAAAFPLTAPLGAGMMWAGNLARGARGLNAVRGAVSGVTSDVAAQGATEMGAGTVGVEAARLAGGLAPEFKNLAGYALKKALGVTGISELGAVLKKTAQNMGVGSETDLSAQQRQYIEGLIKEARGGAVTVEQQQAPLKNVYGGLERVANGEMVKANRNADAIITNAEANAQKLLADTMKGPVAQRQKGLAELPVIGETALEAAKSQRTNIGKDIEIGDIGASLRDVVVPRHKAAIEAKDAAYKADKIIRDDIVNGKEASGIFPESMPEYKFLMRDLQKALLNTAEARAAAKGDLPIGGADVTEQGVKSVYERIYDAVKRRRVQTGVNEEGNPTFQEFATKFGAIDDVRRKLGDVLKGTPPEGYEAISKGIAQKYYAQIDDLQKKFAGDAQVKLQSHYADAMGDITSTGYTSKTGKKFTALDKFNPEEFANDASNLPKQFFKTPETVKALVELTGDRGIVVQAARDFATKSLTDLNEQGVRKWMTANSNWLKTMPEVTADVGKYADALARGERVARNTKTGAAIVEKSMGQMIGASEKSAASMVSAGEKQAAGVLSDAQKVADTLIGSKFPVLHVSSLITSGDREVWKLAAPAIAKDPQARESIVEAVTHVMLDRVNPKGSNVGLVAFFNARARPALVDGGLATKAQVDAIENRLANIEKMNLPQQEKLSATKRMLAESLGGAAASKVSSETVDLYRKNK
jgi:hypothetical protein